MSHKLRRAAEVFVAAQQAQQRWDSDKSTAERRFRDYQQQEESAFEALRSRLAHSEVKLGLFARKSGEEQKQSVALGMRVHAELRQELEEVEASRERQISTDRDARNGKVA
jgi:hypothetical protein